MDPLVISHVQIPRFVYGTAWKKERTTELVTEAIRNGFTGIDTACQPKHYREDLVGEGIRKAIDLGLIKREALYVQTKFTSLLGQDPHNIPYDPEASIETQVGSSVATSLRNLGTSSDGPAIDTLIMHSPLQTINLTIQAWRALEQYVPKDIRCLGISNIDIGTLKALYDEIMIKPVVIQNRFYPRNFWDRQIRRFCTEKNIVYQSFWTLTANPMLLQSDAVMQVAQAVVISHEAALYLLVMSLGDISVLNGTTNTETMTKDLASITAWKQWLTQKGNAKAWTKYLEGFRALIGDVDDAGSVSKSP